MRGDSIMAKIIIRRKSSMVGSIQNHDVYRLNTFVGNLKNGQTLEIPVDVGIHMLSFNSTMKKFGINATFNAVVNEPDEIIELKTKFGTGNKYVVEYADNKPHIPTGVNALVQNVDRVEDKTKDDIETKDNNESETRGVHCPRCKSYDLVPVSEVSTKGKDFHASDACCGYLLCGPLGLLCGATGKGKQTITTTYWMCKGCGNKFKA